MTKDLHINPETKEPYRELNEFTYNRLPPELQKLYKWMAHSLRYVYIGDIKEWTATSI